MFLRFSNLLNNFFFYPEEGVASPDLGKEDILDILNEEDDTPEKENKDKEDKTKKVDETEEESDSEEDEEDIELKEDEEEKEEEVDEDPTLIHASPKQILKKYPKLFEEFPSLKKAYYREQQYSEVFPSVVEAREASEKAQILDDFEGSLLKGNTKDILKTVKEKNPNAFNKIVDSYLDTLREVDSNAHLHLISNITKDIITHIAKAGKTANDDDLLATAARIHEFFFGKTEWVPPQKLAKEEKEEDNEIERERQELLQERLDIATNEVTDKIENTLKSTIRAYIDPKELMTSYVRGKAEEDVLKNLYTEIRKDTRFSRAYDDLWKEAAKTKFSKPSLDKIKAAFNAKAKTLLRPLIQASREAALKDARQNNRDESDSNKRKGHVAIGKPASQSSNRQTTSKKEIPKGMSTLDFFNMD